MGEAGKFSRAQVLAATRPSTRQMVSKIKSVYTVVESGMKRRSERDAMLKKQEWARRRAVTAMRGRSLAAYYGAKELAPSVSPYYRRTLDGKLRFQSSITVHNEYQSRNFYRFRVLDGVDVAGASRDSDDDSNAPPETVAERARLSVH